MQSTTISTVSRVKLGAIDKDHIPHTALEIRAARFGLVTAGSTVATDEKKAARAARFGNITPTTSTTTTTPVTSPQQTATNLSDAEKAKQLRASRFGGVKQADQRTSISKSLGNKAFGMKTEPPKQDDPVKSARAARFAQAKLN